MKVLQLIDSLNAGGAERLAVNIANELSQSVEQSYLCATREEGLLKSQIDPKVRYFFLQKKSSLDMAALWRLLKILQKNRIDILHAHGTSFFMATLLRILRPRTKLIWHDHYGNSENLNLRPHKVLRWCSRYFSLIFCVNHNLVTWNEEKLRASEVVYLANFVLEKEDQDLPIDLEGQTGKRLLCVANLRAQKDHFTLIKAFNRLRDSHPEITLHLVGHDFKDAYSIEIRQLVKRLKIESSVFFYGSRSDVRAFMKSCDIGVLSSGSEGLPLVLLEYGLNKMAVVATDVGDTRKIISNENTGFLVPPNDEEALKEAFEILFKYPNLRSHFGSALYSHVKGEFGAKKAMKTLYLTYKRVLLN